MDLVGPGDFVSKMKDGGISATVRMKYEADGTLKISCNVSVDENVKRTLPHSASGESKT